MRILFLLLFVTFAFVGCSGGLEIQQVYIPTKCEVDYIPTAPTRDSNDLQSLKNNLEYYEIMEGIALECAIESKKD